MEDTEVNGAAVEDTEVNGAAVEDAEACGELVGRCPAHAGGVFFGPEGIASPWLPGPLWQASCAHNAPSHAVIWHSGGA